MSKQTLIPVDTSKQRSPNAAMIVSESQSSPPTTTDQYHHSETIWRVILDIVSLIICKNRKFLLEKLLFFYCFSNCYNCYITFCCSAICTWIFLFGYINKISIQKRYHSSLCCSSFINWFASGFGNRIISSSKRL